MSQQQAASKTFEIASEHGFHLRPISMLVELALQYDSQITVAKGEVSVGAKSVMELLLLGAQQGDVLEVTAVGPDGPEALDAIEEFFHGLAKGNN
jgi:phosphotransferase system HPr (HPr) family protein